MSKWAQINQVPLPKMHFYCRKAKRLAKSAWKWEIVKTGKYKVR